MLAPRLADLEAGEEIFARTFAVDRDRLVRYAGASGDFNPIHYNERFAREVGLPGVIAHGMLTMGLAATAVAEWVGDPGAVVEYGVRFTRSVPVPDPGQATVDVVGKVGAVDADGGTVRIDLAVTSGGAGVLGKARASVRLR